MKNHFFHSFSNLSLRVQKHSHLFSSWSILRQSNHPVSHYSWYISNVVWEWQKKISSAAFQKRDKNKAVPDQGQCIFGRSYLSHGLYFIFHFALKRSLRENSQHHWYLGRLFFKHTWYFLDTSSTADTTKGFCFWSLKLSCVAALTRSSDCYIFIITCII